MKETVVINEEVPGVDPHWFITIPYLRFVYPMFNTLDDAVKFCNFMGWSYTTSYFES